MHCTHALKHLHNARNGKKQANEAFYSGYYSWRLIFKRIVRIPLKRREKKYIGGERSSLIKFQNYLPRFISYQFCLIYLKKGTFFPMFLSAHSFRWLSVRTIQHDGDNQLVRSTMLFSACIKCWHDILYSSHSQTDTAKHTRTHNLHTVEKRSMWLCAYFGVNVYGEWILPRPTSFISCI